MTAWLGVQLQRPPSFLISIGVAGAIMFESPFMHVPVRPSVFDEEYTASVVYIDMNQQTSGSSVRLGTNEN